MSDQRNEPSLRDWLAERTDSERDTIAKLWRMPPDASCTPTALADAMLQAEVMERLLAALSPQERAALTRVQAEGGSIAAPVLEREYGGVRVADKYPNPRAFLLALEQAPAPTERLWIMGLLHVVRHDNGQRYVIPTDVLPLLPPVPLRDRGLKLAPTEPPATAHAGESDTLERNLLLLITLAYEGQLEVVPKGGLNKASLLRFARSFDTTETLQGVSREEQWPYARFLREVAEGAELLRAGADARLRPTRAALEWMRMPQHERARRLLDGWIESSWDELASFVGLKIQRSYWRNLHAAKRAVLRLLRGVPPGEWVRLDDFVAAVKDSDPDFARPDGRYDTWGIVNRLRQPLDGWEFWDAVEGQQLCSIAGGSMHWFGIVDVGMEAGETTSFRVNALGAALLHDWPAPPELPAAALIVQPNFEIVVPQHAALHVRFQVGRIAERVSAPNESAHIYKLTKRRTQAALERDIAPDDMLRFLEEASGRAVPQNVAATLREWAGQHGQVSLRRAAVLKAREPAMLEQIKRDKRVHLGAAERLTDTAWLVRAGDAPALAERLRKAGYGLATDLDGVQSPLREHDLTVLFAALDFYERACATIGAESDVSGAMRGRISNMLNETQLNRAYQASHAALEKLKEKLP
ncbi:MAG TPA: helicase-associated domain-containing protein [Roseiflexaceae bacterium]|nr:helicase-associated domain-containing protein [Roseiflexaceae bacterium]